MSNHQILNPADHGALRIKTGAGSALGDGVSASLAVPAEFQRLACEYPILFQFDRERGAYSALALFGFEPGENLYIGDDRWDAACKPLAMAVQPFLVGRSQSGEGPAQVHVDMIHPRISSDGSGAAVFGEGGQPSPYLAEVVEMIGALDEGYRASDEFFAALARYDLFEPFSMDVTLASGAMHRMVGYHLINEGKLAALEPTVLAELHGAGHLGPIYMAIASLGNLGKLVRRKNRQGDG
jgi:hypothetical protein